MRRNLHLALLAFAVTATAHAQITSPDTLVASAPRNPARASIKPGAADLQWLWQYKDNKPALQADPRFKALLTDHLKAPQAMWGLGIPLSDAAQAFLSGPGTVASTDNRRLTVTGCVVDPETAHCAQRGLLYIDTRDTLIVFSALRWNEQARSIDEPGAPFTLWIFPSRELEPAHLPEALKQTLASFATHGGCNAPNILNTIVVDPTGVPHILSPLSAGIPPALCETKPASTQ